MARKRKGNGTFRQLIDVFTMVRKSDRTAVPILLLSLLAPLGAGIAVAVINADPIGSILWVTLGLVTGVLVVLIVLGRLAQKMVYNQLNGQPGAVGAILKNSIRRSWVANETPIRITKQQDAVYRTVGRPGIVIITEGTISRVASLGEDARKEAARIVPGVPISILHVGTEGLRIHDMTKAMYALPKGVNRAEQQVIASRLASMTKSPLSSIPKGIDPTKMRAPKPR